MSALGRLFKPWKWKRRKKSEKFDKASKCKENFYLKKIVKLLYNAKSSQFDEFFFALRTSYKNRQVVQNTKSSQFDELFSHYDFALKIVKLHEMRKQVNFTSYFQIMILLKKIVKLNEVPNHIHLTN